MTNERSNISVRDSVTNGSIDEVGEESNPVPELVIT
jgi:hypothetical protein